MYTKPLTKYFISQAGRLRGPGRGYLHKNKKTKLNIMLEQLSTTLTYLQYSMDKGTAVRIFLLQALCPQLLYEV